MSTDFDKLLMIQERDRKIAQLERESRDIPARKAEIETRLKAQTESLAAAEEDLKRETAATHQIEVEIDSLKTKITKFREQQLQIKSNDDYKTLEKEIFRAEKDIRKCEDRELEIMERMEQARAVIKEREDDLNREKAVVQQDMDVLDKRNEAITGEIHDVKTDRESLTGDVDEEWLARYERILAHHKDFAIVGVENGACGGCHIQLPPQRVNDAKKGLEMVTCNYCGRVLYVKM